MSNRELDALVAAYVMGWGKFPEAEFLPYQGWHCDNVVIPPYGVLPRFSTDPVACRTLKDKMRAEGWFYFIHARSTGECLARFYRDEGPDFETTTEAEASDPSEFRAIVVAALRAYGVEVPE